MADQSLVRTAPFGSIATLQAVNSIQNAFEALLSWNTSRRTRAILAGLSDEMLDDIGLSRGDIARM